MNNSLKQDEYLFISPEGYQKTAALYDPKDPMKNVFWTTDYTIELPIRMKTSGQGADKPQTLIEVFVDSVKKYGNKPALSVKRQGQWQTINYLEFYRDCCDFANALIALKITRQKAINILGYNSPEWVISFYGSIFANNLPVGIYITNGPDACHYVSENSDCELVVLENQEHLNKYLKIWDKLPLLKYAVIYDDPNIKIPEQYKNRIFQWKDLLKIGKEFKPVDPQDKLENRFKSVKPGHCCTLVYTSGTTGNPKGVMLSHDNYTWRNLAFQQKYINLGKPEQRNVSYLPLSHVAAQVIDLIAPLTMGGHVFFATPDALQGSLIPQLQEIRPTIFFSVPRVWEKIEEKMKSIAAQNSAVKKSIGNWAKGIGAAGTYAEIHKKSLPLCFNLAKKLVYTNVKKALGLDNVDVFFFGAAPLAPSTREYFLSLNFQMNNAYGMSECAGATTVSNPLNFDSFDINYLKSAGNCEDGIDLKIDNPDKDGNGEICYRGRHIFMGYYKNEESTRQTIDKDGFLHSGDVGKLDKKGNLYITGRIKELLITGGGENVAPVLIENQVKDFLPFISNCMVIGDQQKYLTIFITLKQQVDKSGKFTDELMPESIVALESLGVKAKSVSQAKTDATLKKIIDQGIEKANEKAISKAQTVRKWLILPNDFSIEGGELTPTMKLKRGEVMKKYPGEVDQLYIDAKL